MNLVEELIHEPSLLVAAIVLERRPHRSRYENTFCVI